MASAYASLVSLIHVLNRVQHPTCPASFDKLQIQSLLDKTNSLVDFLEAYSQQITEDFGRKMVRAAYAAEDTIETYVTDIILEKASRDAYGELCKDLEKIILEMDILVQEAMEVKENNNGNNPLLLRYTSVDSPMAPSGMIKMVGWDDELTRLMGQLTTGQTSRQIISIVGMGGIGKTTLATNLYYHPSITHHFDVKTWVTISQNYSVDKIIHTLILGLGVLDMDKIGSKRLGDQLHKSLYGRRYLVILDDVWDAKAWDEIYRFFPDNNNKSRILVTTRILDVGRIVGSGNLFQMKLLDGDGSWDLLSKKVFVEGSCPPELEDLGKKIAYYCKGLPLTISVIGGLLKTSRKTLDFWEDVAQNVSFIISREDGNHCLKILSLSYHQLPIHLKPCFLYLATYPHDYEIQVSQLIKLWVADGFIRPNVGDVTMDDVALQYLQELGNKNLITIKGPVSEGEIECFTVHDLVMDLCMREVQKEGFLLFVNYVGENCPQEIESWRRLVFRGSTNPSMLPNELSRSYISFTFWDPSHISQLRLLRSCVLRGKVGHSYLTQFVNLRFLEFSVDLHYCKWFQKISLMWNLETLIVRNISDRPGIWNLPPEIWNLSQIKHLIFHKRVSLPDPPTSDADCVLQNLQTLDGVQILNDRVFDMVPNIKKMNVQYEHHHHKDTEISHGFGNMFRCQKLEILSMSLTHCSDLKTIMFAHSLRKLTLYSNTFQWQKCGVGLLPNLETFTLEHSYFDDRKWNTVDGEFQKLNTLSLKECNLKSWTVEECCHFPSLEHLILKEERYLDGISQVFGESMTLKSIELVDCSYAIVMSAKQILDEQQRQGNDEFMVNADRCGKGSWYTKEMTVDLLSMKTENFHIVVD